MDGMDEIVQEFLVESYENLDQLDRDLVELERDPGSRELLSSVFRTLHTIKGTSGFLAFHRLESLTHVAESLLARLRDGVLTLTPAITSVLLEAVDAVRALLADIESTGAEGERDYAAIVVRLEAALEGGEPSPSPTPEAFVEADPEPGAEPDAEPDAELPASRRTAADGSIRVDVDLLDSLMNLVGELVLARNQLVQRAAARHDTELQRSTHRLNLIAGELQEGVMKTRMQPIDTVWSKLPRVVRDLSVQLGKQVRLDLVGRDTELDKTILESVKDPLTHLVRNAVDHGIESPERRLAAGKPAEGTLTLRAFHEGGQVNIEISDDGAGIDPARLRARAVERGILTADAAARLSERESYGLIFAPGFSTAETVTNVSGRGVGMDVVKTNIEKIGGLVDVLSEPGRGTTIRVKIPLTLAIIPALIVTADEGRFAIPQVNLLELVRLDAGGSGPRIENVQGTPVYRLRGRLLPLVSLREQLGLPAAESETTYIAVLQADGRQYGLVVDTINDTEEIVVKPLGRQLRQLPLYAGATIMGDGQIALILDTIVLAARAGMVADGGTRHEAELVDASGRDGVQLLLVGLSDGRRVGLPLAVVDRLEEFERERFERVGVHEVVQYRDRLLPTVRIDAVFGAFGTVEESAGPVQVVVCEHQGVLVGFVVHQILDIVDAHLDVRSPVDTGGHLGSAVVAGRVTELVDVARAVSGLDPVLFAEPDELRAPDLVEV
ncbi:MAG: chemotaxis protein CheA [Nocardioidaceae bacterium]|nr:chemotaxis protein CheA [Nocardioidaceae bacterium]